MSKPRNARGDYFAHPYTRSGDVDEFSNGLTIREHFAGLIAASLAPSWAQSNAYNPEWAARVAILAVDLADALLLELSDESVQMSSDKGPHIEEDVAAGPFPIDSIRQAYERTKEGGKP